MEKDLTIVIPCFNEAKSLPIIIEKCLKLISNKHIFVVLVNNGSNDETASVLEKIKDKHNNLSIVNVKNNLGYGNGILMGLEKANTKYVGWTHADLQTDILDLENAYIELNKYAFEDIYIKGKRIGRGFFDNIFTIGMSFFETLIFRSFLWEINAQPTILPRIEYLNWVNPPTDFSLDLFSYVNAKKSKLRIIRLKVYFPPRKFGTSSWNTSIGAKLKFIKRTLSYSFKLMRSINVNY